jgi:putative oxidoreductase
MSVITEIGAGALLVLGFLTPLAGAAVISVMLVAGLLAHRKNGFFVFKDGYEYVLLIAVVCLLLGALGPGHFSVDYAAGIQVTGWAGAGIALGVAVAATAGLLATFYRPAPKPAPAPATSEASVTSEASEASVTSEASEASVTSEASEAAEA